MVSLALPHKSEFLAKPPRHAAAKSTFDQVLSIHVYSIQPGKLNVFTTPALHVHFTANAKQDLHVLTECNRAIMATAVNEDLLETSKQYGIIQNSQVKVRLHWALITEPTVDILPVAPPHACSKATASSQRSTCEPGQVHVRLQSTFSQRNFEEFHISQIHP